MTITPAQVKVLVNTDKSDTDVELFITTATLLVTEVLSDAGHSTDRLEQITLYLAAHYLTLSAEGGGLRRAKLGDADESYVVPDGSFFGIQSTRFGQQALSLDTTGLLAASQANKSIRATFRVV